MTKSFEIIRTKSDKFPLIIVGNNYFGLGEYISDVEVLLRRTNFKGNVIFDLLLANGYKARNRFMTSYFDGKHFIEPQIININYRNEIIIKHLERFYFSNIQILSNGILSKTEITIIKTTHNILYK